MDDTALKLIIEALLMSSGEPLSIEKMLTVFDEHEVTAHSSPTSRGLSAGSRNSCASLDPGDKPRDVGGIERGEQLHHEKPTRAQLQRALVELENDYALRAVELKCLAGGYCLQTKQHYSSWVARLLSEKPAKYSNAFLEVLAIIAYRQPVTRADIEEIRGVAVSSSMLKTLIEREWIHIAGHRDVPGKPAVYTTTHVFLDYFNLASLNDLPPLGISLEESVINNE